MLLGAIRVGPRTLVFVRRLAPVSSGSGATGFGRSARDGQPWEGGPRLTPLQIEARMALSSFPLEGRTGSEDSIVGAHAVMYYADPRCTKDLGVWVNPASENAPAFRSVRNTPSSDKGPRAATSRAARGEALQPSESIKALSRRLRPPATLCPARNPARNASRSDAGR